MASVSPPTAVTLLAFLYVVGLPLLVFLHEFGHAAVALALTDSPIRIALGDDPEPLVTVGRLTVSASFLSGWIGFSHAEGEMRPTERAAYALAGPAVSLAVCLTAFGLVRGGVGDPRIALVLEAVALGAGWQFLVTAAPVRYPEWWTDAYAGHSSDGHRALRALRG